MNSKNQSTKIVIVGAGYAGLMAAQRLAGKTRGLNVQLTLINGSDRFDQRPLLPRVATGQDVKRTPLAKLLRGTAVELRQGWITAIDPEQKEIQIQTKQGVEAATYDFLVYALGSVVDQESVPGVREHSYVLNPHGANGAAALHARLQTLAARGAKVIVVGGGATGIEGATEIKGRYPDLQVGLVTAGRFAAFKGTYVEAHIRDAFAEQGISFQEGERVVAVDAHHLLLEDGRTIPFDLCLWAGGFRALPLARQAGFIVNERDQIVVDPYGRSLSFVDVYAVGDAAHSVEEPGVPLRMSLHTAITRGAHAADNIAALLKGQKQTPLSFAYYGQSISLGPEDAVGFASYPAEAPPRVVLRGKTAAAVRRAFLWMYLVFYKLERRWPGFYFWLGKGRYERSRMAGAEQSHAITGRKPLPQGGDGYE